MASGGIDAHARQGHLGAVGAVLSRRGAARQARRIRRHKEEADAALVAARAGGAGRNDEMVRRATMDDHGLLAVENPGAAILLRRGGDIEEVVARMPLGGGQSIGAGALGDRRDMRSLLLRGTSALQHAAGQNDCREIGLEHKVLPEALEDQHGLDRPAAEAAILFGERQAEDAKLGELRPDPGAPATGERGDLLALLEAVGVGEEALHRVLQELLFFGEIEIHGGSLSVGFRAKLKR